MPRLHRESPISTYLCGVGSQQALLLTPELPSADPPAVLTFPSPHSCILETSLSPRPQRQGSGFMNTVFVLRGSRCTEGFRRNNKYHSGFPRDLCTVVSLLKKMWTKRQSPRLPSPTSGQLGSQDRSLTGLNPTSRKGSFLLGGERSGVGEEPPPETPSYLGWRNL